MFILNHSSIISGCLLSEPFVSMESHCNFFCQIKGISVVIVYDNMHVTVNGASELK